MQLYDIQAAPCLDLGTRPSPNRVIVPKDDLYDGLRRAPVATVRLIAPLPNLVLDFEKLHEIGYGSTSLVEWCEVNS